MAPLTDPVRLTAYRNALANWPFTGFVTWKERAAEWVRRELEGFTTKEIARLMHEHVERGGQIDEQRETREGLEGGYHYDLRFPVGGRWLYIETLLCFRNPEDPDDPTIRVVSIHDK
jgi:hypothetical protein